MAVPESRFDIPSSVLLRHSEHLNPRATITSTGSDIPEVVLRIEQFQAFVDIVCTCSYPDIEPLVPLSSCDLFPRLARALSSCCRQEAIYIQKLFGTTAQGLLNHFEKWRYLFELKRKFFRRSCNNILLSP